MSQSKMAVDNHERKFAIKHTFKDIMNMHLGDEIHGPIEYHFNIPWKTRIFRLRHAFKIYLDCMIRTDNTAWYIDAYATGKTIRNFEEIHHDLNFSVRYGNSARSAYYIALDSRTFSSNGNVKFEFSMTIRYSVGLNLAGKLNSRDDKSAKEDSDVTLVVKGKKFYVLKKYLAHHSTYFKSLFFGSFAESQKSVIELKDIDPEEFQNFVDFIYVESDLKTNTVLGILHLADFFDAKTVVRRCQEFLIYNSEVPLKKKFETAVKYKLEELKTKCMSEMKTAADFQSIVPETADEFDPFVWKELFAKALTLIPK